MKTLTTAILAIFFVTAVYAENSNAILFTENGERFKVVLNGILQNTSAQTNVKLTELNAPNYKCRILFEDTSLGYVDFNLFFPNQGYEVTWNIKKNNKGAYVVRYVSDVPISEAPPTPPTQPVVVYTAVPASSTTTTTTQQTTTGTAGDGFNLNMGINTHENGGSINIQSSGMDGGMHQSGYTTTTTTTTTSQTVTTSSAGGYPPPPPPPGGHPGTPPPPVVYVPGYNGSIGCPVPVSQSEFSQMKESINSKTFEDTKLTMAKQILRDNCVTSAQVRDLLNLFTFETSKLDFAKYAYSKTYDIGNYYKVNDAFEFESSVDDLNDYISK